MHYLVAYRVSDTARLVRLAQTLQQCRAWWNDIPNLWVVCTDETVDQLYARCTQALSLNNHGGDLLWVRQLAPHQAQNGWLPAGAWDWLQHHRVG
jgi:hypothetical protein